MKGLNAPETIFDSSIIPIIVALFFLKIIPMYLIACYAKSVSKSPYWSLAGALAFPLSVIMIWIGLWRETSTKTA
jgi:hypothetical protein